MKTVEALVLRQKKKTRAHALKIDYERDVIKFTHYISTSGDRVPFFPNLPDLHVISLFSSYFVE